MGDAARNCKRIETMESSTSCSLPKKMKFESDNEEVISPSDLRFFTTSPKKTATPATSSASGGVLAGDFCLSSCSGGSPASGCSSNDLSEVVKDNLRLLDLEAKSFETESKMYIENKCRETTPSSKLCGDTNGMDSLAPERTSRKKTPEVKMPTEAEIEEFFAVAEQEEQKKFAEKYNYDIVKDMPLEGRYQWARFEAMN